MGSPNKPGDKWVQSLVNSGRNEVLKWIVLKNGYGKQT